MAVIRTCKSAQPDSDRNAAGSATLVITNLLSRRTGTTFDGAGHLFQDP
jgi:hypothetical protein